MGQFGRALGTGGHSDSRTETSGGESGRFHPEISLLKLLFQAIFEFIATESAYVRDLQLIVELFYSRLLNVMEQKAITVVFANVEDILLINTVSATSPLNNEFNDN